MDLKEQIDELRKMTDELTRHAGTNEAHQIAKVTERIYYLALEVYRLDGSIQLLAKRK